MFKNIEKQNIVIPICFVLVLIYMLYTGLVRENHLNNDYDFTVGKTIKFEFSDGFKDCIKYEYYVGDVKFVECVTVDSKIISPLNKFYKVKYSKEKPEISEMYLDEEIKDSIQIIHAGFKNKNN